MKNFRIIFSIIFSIFLFTLFAIIFYQEKTILSLQEKSKSLQKENKDLMLQIEKITEEKQHLESTDKHHEHFQQPLFLQEDWEKVVIESDDQKLIIDSPLFLDAFLRQFTDVIQTENPYPSGYPIKYKFKIFTNHGEYTFFALENSYFMDENMNTFYRSGEDITQIWQALVSKPKDYPEETFMSKLFHSGIMIVEDHEYYFTKKYRIQGIVSAFLNLAKEEVTQPTNLPHYLEKISFYYFGEKYVMTFYDKYIHIYSEQTAIDYWYKVENKDVLAILDLLNAG